LEKHTPYFKVLETIQKSRDCGLCVLEKGAVHSYFEAFLYENVNDHGAREALRASRGWCPFHAHHLIGFHDTLALSILFKEQALLAGYFLEKQMEKTHFFSEWVSHAKCPACIQTIQIRQHYLAILVKGLIEEEEMRSAFFGNFHVCLNHFMLVVDALSDDAFKRQLVDRMWQRLADLAGRLEQYCQDCQINAAGETFDSPHRYAWKEAVETVAGLKDVFESPL
jgi:hypothetical protein